MFKRVDYLTCTGDYFIHQFRQFYRSADWVQINRASSSSALKFLSAQLSVHQRRINSAMARLAQTRLPPRSITVGGQDSERIRQMKVIRVMEAAGASLLNVRDSWTLARMGAGGGRSLNRAGPDRVGRGARTRFQVPPRSRKTYLAAVTRPRSR